MVSRQISRELVFPVSEQVAKQQCIVYYKVKLVGAFSLELAEFIFQQNAENQCDERFASNNGKTA